MLYDYSKYNNLTLDINNLSQRIYFFTSGYPFLVSSICKIIDEKIYPNNKETWNVKDIDRAVSLIISDVNILSKYIIKNLENNKELHSLTKSVLIDKQRIRFDPLYPKIRDGIECDIFKKCEDGLEISNKIFQKIIYNYMIAKTKTNSFQPK